MLLTTTNDIEGKRITTYYGIVSGETIIGANKMSEQAERMGANAVLAVDLDYETIGESMLMVTASGTAVRYE